LEQTIHQQKLTNHLLRKLNNEVQVELNQLKFQSKEEEFQSFLDFENELYEQEKQTKLELHNQNRIQNQIDESIFLVSRIVFQLNRDVRV